MHIYSRRMKNVCNKKILEVFDFKEEPEVTEYAFRIKSKVESPSNAIDKYTFLTTAAAGKNISAEEIDYVPSLDIDAINTNHVTTTLIEDDSARMMVNSKVDAFIVAEHCPESSPELRTYISESEVNVAATSASPSNDKLNSAILDLFPSLHEHDETVEMDPDENGNMCERSSSSDVAEDDGAGPSSDHCMGDWELDSEDITTVVLYPDYVVYRDSYYTDSVINFTSSFIEMEGSTEDGDDETFKCKWGIDDIFHIKSHWYERIEMAMVNIHLATKDTVQTENVECTRVTELKFAVIGSSWFGRLEAIMSLNVTYKALWCSMLESEDSVLGHTEVSFKKYIPNFDQPFEEVVYPKGDADAVSINKRDFDLLQPDTFVNDTIIDFYIKYLKNKIKAEERHRFHFFNSFFFRKLADPDKDPLNASQGRAAYQRVRKWTRKVNLFEKDYIFIPVNYNYHWSLIVICHLGEVATYKDEGANESIKVPCVLHMDSIRGSHSGLKGLVQSYLREEWIARQQEASEEISSRFDNLRFFSLELPQQQNSFDCGLFLLHYVELFLEEAPLHFNPFKITKSSSFLNVGWFPPSEASLKRVIIQKLICDLLENPYQESSSTAVNEERSNLSRPTMIVQSTVVNLSAEDFNRSVPHLNTHNGHEIGIIDDDHNISLKSFNDTQFPTFNHTDTTYDQYKSSLTPIEQEDVEGGDQFVYSHTESGIQQDNEIMGDYFRTQENNCKASISGSEEDSIEIVNESGQLDSEVNMKKRRDEAAAVYGEMVVDGNEDDDDPTSSSMDMMLPFRFQGSESRSGLESDLQHPTKKMRMTESS